MSDTPNYVEYRPPADGVAPPYWREGMKWTRPTMPADFDGSGHPEWLGGWEYHVEPEALTAPNEDASGDVDTWAESDAKRILRLVESLRAYPAETLLKHGITLAPERDWATELWADLFAVRGMPSAAKSTREGRLDDEDQAAIALIRERVVLKGEG